MHRVCCVVGMHMCRRLSPDNRCCFLAVVLLPPHAMAAADMMDRRPTKRPSLESP